jgi:hypothetical protein
VTALACDAAAALLDRAVWHVGRSPDLAAVADLARWLSGQVTTPGWDGLAPELARAGAESHRTGEGVVVAEGGGGHVMVVRYFPPHAPTPIHGHGGWGAVVVLDGIGRYQTWQPTRDGYARVTEVRVLAAGDTLGWADPPHDVHRQEGLGGGVTELTVFARHPYRTWAPRFQPAGDPIAGL